MILKRSNADSVLEYEKKFRTKNSDYWRINGEHSALRLFHAMARRVPAYADFLRTHGFSPSSVKKAEDLTKVPIINKDNYLRTYPRNMLSWDGQYPKGSWVVSTTSGSTGQPYYFPRQQKQDQQYAQMAELYLRANFEIQNKKTLYIVAFPMGAWIGGVFTYEALQLIAKKDRYDLTVITPGIHKQEIISAIKELAKDFDQVIIGAYAPFLKDIIEDGTAQGIDWKALNVGFIFSAEAFSESFRKYILEAVDAEDYYRTTLNHYGTVDLGTMAHETPLSILVRKTMYEHPTLGAQVLPDTTKQPTIAQYVPEQFFFEEIATSNLLCSADAGLPLVRYDLKDFGGIIPYVDLDAAFAQQGLNLQQLIVQEGLSGSVNQLPLVYVYERNDMSVSYYAFLIYPDTIRRALYASHMGEAELTGKFTLAVDYDDAGKQQLTVHVELRPHVTKDKWSNIKTQLRKTFHEALFMDVSEYRETYRMMGASIKPLVVMHEYEAEDYFRGGAKQKWVIK